MPDHKILVHIWRLLRQEKNVLVFVDSNSYEYGIELIGKWFQPLVRNRLNAEELRLQNDTFLVFRKLLWGVNEATRGSYEIVALGSADFDDIIHSLEKRT